jgi:probable F420-dependent oxidoreductase
LVSRRDGQDFGMTSAALPLLGFGLPVSGSWATPATITRIARRAEQLGYASLWSFQRVLFPAELDIGTPYRSVLDPVVPLAYAAAVTDRIRLGTALVNAPFLAPAVLAKQLTSLDVVSGGRLDAGLGLGWSPDEYEAAGVPFARRGARMDEYLRCLHALWTQDPVEFAGEFYSVARSHARPAPVQQPHPPVLLGGSAQPALRRAGRLANGWISSSRHDLTQIGSSVAVVRSAAQEAGRDPQAARIVVRGLVDLLDAAPTGDRRPLHGTAEQVRDDLRWLAAQGVTEVFLDLNFSPRVGSPDVDPEAATRYAEQVLDAFAPS